MKRKRFYIRNLFISNFKPFKCQNPPQKISFIDNDGDNIQFMMLSGFNGYGKTSIFQAIEFILNGKIEIFEFRDTTRKYTEHVSINELNKESLMVLEIENEHTKECISIIRYNPSVEACKEKECLVEYENFDLYILNETFEYESFKKKLETGEITIASSNIMSKLLDENSLDEWLTANYLKQEQSSNILFKNNSSRVDFINQFINQDSHEYFEKYELEDEKLNEEIKKTKSILKTIKDKIQKKQVDSIGEKPQNLIIFEDLKIIWDKLDFDDKEDFETYISGLNNLKTINENLELYVSKDKLDEINKLLTQQELISEIIIYKFAKENLSLYLDDFMRKKYLIELSGDQETLKSDQLNRKYFGDDLIDRISKFKSNSETLNKLSSDKQKLYSKLKTLRKNIQKDSSLVNNLFDETCPLCGHDFKNEEIPLNEAIKAHEEAFIEIQSLLEDNNDALAANIEQKYKEIASKISEIVQSIEIDEKMYNHIKKISDSQSEYSIHEERLEYLLNQDLEEYLSGDKFDLKMIDNICEQVIKSLVKIVEDVTAILDDIEFDDDELKNLQNNRKYFKELINYPENELVEKFNRKEEVLKWYLSKQQFDTYSKEKNQYDQNIEILKSLSIKSKKVKKIISKVKDAKHKYMTDLIRYIEIPLYIYSGKLMQTHQNGLGVFCTTGSSDKVTQFKLTTNGNVSGHDIVNKFSAGQKAVMNIAVILAFRKIRSSSLDLFMIDDPCQSMDDINIASLTEILRNEFDKTQILISTHDDSTSGYMCYKYHKSGKTYKELNVQETFYSIN